MDDMSGASGDTYELDELLGAYALDAVDDDERRRVDDYLEVNPRASAEVQALSLIHISEPTRRH